jgi:hypothetical protein
MWVRVLRRWGSGLARWIAKKGVAAVVSMARRAVHFI